MTSVSARFVSVLAFVVATASAAQSPAARAGHVMTTAGSGGGVYLVGGQIIDDAPRLIDTLWQWNGSSWRAASNAGPHNRSLLAAAFDTKRGVLVIYGGVGIGSGTRFGDTWEWNGQRWEERNLQTPGARDHHAMTYDEARGQVVMYGGAVGPTQFFRDTWTYDGTKWLRADTTGAPGGLVHHAMAYDSRRQRVVMVGGFDQSNNRTTDVWEWDGVKWHRIQVTGATPTARSHHRLAYDAVRGVTVLFGGGRRTAETWTWDGTTWTQHAVTGPPGRDTHAMAFDSRRGRVVLFGGGGSQGQGVPPYRYMHDTWEWDGTQWHRGEPGQR